MGGGGERASWDGKGGEGRASWDGQGAGVLTVKLVRLFLETTESMSL